VLLKEDFGELLTLLLA